MIGGAIHALLGASGLIGLLLRFIGPITIVPCMILGSVFIVVPILTLVKVHWGIALS